MKVNVIYSGKHALPQFETAQSAGMDLRASWWVWKHRQTIDLK